MMPPPPSSSLTPDLRDRLRRHGLRGPASPTPPPQGWEADAAEPPATGGRIAAAAPDCSPVAAAPDCSHLAATQAAALAAALADRDRLEAEVQAARLLARARERRAEAAEAALAEGGGGGHNSLALRALEARLAEETARADAAEAARADLEARVVAATPAVCAPTAADVATWTGEDGVEGGDEAETESPSALVAAAEAALDGELRTAATARVDAAAYAAAAEAARVEAAHWRREVGAAVAAARLEAALEAAAGAEAAVAAARAEARSASAAGTEAGVQTEEVAAATSPPPPPPPPPPPAVAAGWCGASPTPATSSRAASPEARPLRAWQVRQGGRGGQLASSGALPSAASALAGLRALAGGAARLSAGGGV